MSGTTLRFGAARIVSRFSVPRSARGTLSVPPPAVEAAAWAGGVVAAAGAAFDAGAVAVVGAACGAPVGGAAAGAVVAAGALVAGALVGGAEGDPLQAASTARVPPDTIRRSALRRLMPLFRTDRSRSTSGIGVRPPPQQP